MYSLFCNFLITNFLLAKCRPKSTINLELKTLIETFNAIKEIKIFEKENLFYDLMNNFNQKFFNANRNQRFLTNIPKAVLETCLIIIVSTYLVNLHVQNYNFNDYFSEIEYI